MSIAIAMNHMAEMNVLGLLAVVVKSLTEATRDKNQLQRVRRYPVASRSRLPPRTKNRQPHQSR